ncbi:phosphomevalonate kinase [Kwoniella sp. DSM 27419]
MTPRQIIVSSPGKVLLAGGYLVLDRAFSGVVVATSSRFYSCVTQVGALGETTETARISVRAGQFPKDDSTWTYELKTQAHELRLEQVNADQTGKNKFIYITLLKAIEVAYQSILIGRKGMTPSEAVDELLRRIGTLDVVVLADNDFYSQREQLAGMSLPARLSSLPSLPPFNPLPRPIPQTNKTGLGSSAALVTSLVASLLAHLGVVSLESGQFNESGPDHRELSLVHSLAQFAHCLAQGKVGSGFDVSSAVYGTHLYTRFSPSVLSPLMDQPLTGVPLRSASVPGGLLTALSPSNWDSSVKPFRLPRGLRLILADVDAGTDTPSFVGKVLEWRKRDADVAREVWAGLDKDNMRLERALTALVAREGEDDYAEALAGVAGAASLKQTPSPTATLLGEVTETLAAIRASLRKMSDLSGVPIEPPEQTRLIDASSKLPGVIGGGVPGAGGYDALFLLVVDQPTVIDRVDELWAGWTEMSVCPLSARQSDGGLRMEAARSVAGLEAALRRCKVHTT